MKGFKKMKSKNVIGLLGLSGFIVMADNWVVSPILPAISEHLNVDMARAGLLIAAYMIPFGIFQIVFGPLADRYGKKQVITFSMILFTLATGLCALGMGLTDLAIYRSLTGVFAASVMPVSLALIGDIFPIQERQGAIRNLHGDFFFRSGIEYGHWRDHRLFSQLARRFRVVCRTFRNPDPLCLSLITNIFPPTKIRKAEFVAPYAKLLGNSKSLFTYILVFF
jgi:hypothetical protein